MLQNAIIETRKVISGLRPSALDDFGLVTALQHYIQALQEDFDLEVELRETLQKADQEQKKALVDLRKMLDKIETEERVRMAAKLEVRKKHGKELTRLEKAAREVDDWYQ